MDSNQIYWFVARAAGFTAYVLLTGSIALGLTLSLQWRTPQWPRFITKEVHQFLTLLTILFLGIHLIGVALDPFVKFTLPEVLVPLVSHYRPTWVALGIVAAYLVVALYLTEYLRTLIGYSWWRRLHYLTLATWILASAHGLATGSDSHAPWAFWIYSLSFALVATLLLARLVGSTGHMGARGVIGVALLVLGAGGWWWALAGPFQAGWNTIANNGGGSGSRAAVVASATPSASAGLKLPFQDTVSGSLSQPDNNHLSLTLDTVGDIPGTVQVELIADSTGAIDPNASTFALSGSDGSSLCAGHAQSLVNGQITATCLTPSRQQVTIQILVSQRRAGVSGSMTGSQAPSQAV